MSLFGKYKILNHIGTGGHALVYKAEVLSDKQIVAVKKLNIAQCPEQQRNALISRFKKESLISQSLCHPNIVNIYESFECELEHYIVMEFIDGFELDHYIFQNNITLKDILSMFTQMAEALTHVHENQIVHRDIKPENFMVNKSGQIKLMDFGVAKQEGVSSNTMDGSVMGTLAYMSPEQLQNSKNIDERSDIYSLGVVLYQILTAQLPFPANSIAELITSVFSVNPAPPHRLIPEIPVELSAIVSQMLCKDPQDRYPDMKTVAMAFQLIQDMIPQSALSQPIQKLISETETSDSFFDSFIEDEPPPLPVELPAQTESPALRPSKAILKKMNNKQQFLKYISDSLIVDSSDELGLLDAI